MDVLWGEYEGWQPYQYGLNLPTMYLDNGGMLIVAAQMTAQQELITTMQTHFGVTPTFNSQGVMNLPSAQFSQALDRLDAVAMEQLMGIQEIISNRDKILNVFTMAGTDDRVMKLVLTGPGPNNVVNQDVSINEQMTGGQEEKFISSELKPNNAIVVFRPELAKLGRFESGGPEKTPPCATCIMIHALLDHGLPWLQLGADANRIEGVSNHNIALRRIGAQTLRTGGDHDNTGIKR